MARLEQVLPAQRQGKKIRRQCWDKGCFYRKFSNVIVDQDCRVINMLSFDILAEDWEVVGEPECSCVPYTWSKQDFNKSKPGTVIMLQTDPGCSIHGKKKELGCTCADYPLGHVNCPIHGKSSQKIERFFYNPTFPENLTLLDMSKKINEIVEAWNKENE